MPSFFSNTDLRFDTDCAAGCSTFFSSAFDGPTGVDPAFLRAGKGFSAGFFSNIAFKFDTEVPKIKKGCPISKC